MAPDTESFPSSYRLSWRDRLPGPLQSLARFPWWTLILAGVVSLVLADQIAAPNSRIIKLGAGALLLVMAYRLRPFYALCFITLLFPFPFSIFVGSSTMIFIVLAATIYLARLTLRQVAPPSRTPADAFLGILMGCYILSFYNVTNPIALKQGVLAMVAIVASFMVYYMTATFVRTERHLRTFVRILVITAGASMAVAIYELLFPGRVLIPHWILNRLAVGGTEVGYRVGGPFYDFELFGEYMALSFFLCFFMFRRTHNPNTRFFTGALCILSVFCLLTTVTRGATIAFIGGVVYLVWLIRRRLKFRDLVSSLLVLVLLWFGLEFVVVNFTNSGSVMDRLFGTEFEGLVPDSRLHWPKVWARVLDHPFVGHGPYYDLGKSDTLTGHGLYSIIYPHSQYLFYAHTVGLIGAAAFLGIVGRLLWVSFREKAVGLQEPSYARSLMIVLHIMLCVFLVDQTKIEYIRNDTYIFFPWILLGLIAATHRIIRDGDDDDDYRSNRLSPPT